MAKRKDMIALNAVYMDPPSARHRLMCSVCDGPATPRVRFVKGSGKYAKTQVTCGPCSRKIFNDKIRDLMALRDRCSGKDGGPPKEEK